MMGGGRDEERKKMEENPMMFPRIHVNDRVKGGPRAPPRNKMALYEQFSIPLPSQRSTFGMDSSSSTVGGGLQNVTCITFKNIPATSYSAKRQETYSFSGVRLNNMMEANDPSPTSDTTPVTTLTAQASSLFQPWNSHFMRPSRREPDGCEDITIPLLANSKLSSHKACQTESCFKSKRLQLIDMESKELKGVPLLKFPILRKPVTLTPCPDITNAKRPHIMERTRESSSHLQEDPFPQQDSISDGDQVLSALPPNEGRNRSHSELHENVSASSCLLPDDVEKIIGQKNFWKARRALINQQRVFAVQLFELHRIIKVQILISRSPHILFKESLRFRNSGELSPSEFLPGTELNSKTIKENATGELLHARNGEMLRVPPVLQPKQRPSPAKLQGPENSNKPSMWCLPPTGNQWLVPVVSPYEGLVYKPYTGPGPPDSGNPGSIFCPIKFGLGSGKEYLDTALGDPPPVSPSYFLHYGVPQMNSVMPNQTPKQVNSVAWWNAQQPLEQASQVVSHSLSKAPGTELEGSTASSPSERQRREPALPLFPTSTATEKYNSHGSRKQQKKVIKVVPYNSKAATESATRIFRLIQEERKQLTNE